MPDRGPSSTASRQARSTTQDDRTGGSCPPVSDSLQALLGEFRRCFSAWTFPVFCALACGLVAQVGRRTVCGMLVGARLSQTWSHHRAHRFFSHARWSPEAVSAVVTKMVVRLLVADDAPITVAVDDSLFGRRGKKVHAAGWFHDGSAVGERKIGYGNNWVIAAIVVRLAILDRPLALPVGFALIRKQSEDASRLEAARRLVVAIGEALPGRRIDVVADSAYAGKALRALPEQITWTTRLRSNAALYELAPPRTGRRGRPRQKGAKLGSLAELAKKASFSKVEVTRYGESAEVEVAVISCLWYRPFGSQPVQVVFVRERSTRGYDVALVSTDVSVTPATIIERYAARWSIETAIEDAKQIIGVGQARNRVRRAVERTVPFGFTVGVIAVCWYATAGHHPDDVEEVRAIAPWYRHKAQPSVLDMFSKLRRVIVAAQFRSERPGPVTPAEMNILRLAWENVAA
jgi:hypothetical protein